jgi:hypothetical protein
MTIALPFRTILLKKGFIDILNRCAFPQSKCHKALD